MLLFNPTYIQEKQFGAHRWSELPKSVIFDALPNQKEKDI